MGNSIKCIKCHYDHEYNNKMEHKHRKWLFMFIIYVYSATEFLVVPDGYTGLKGPTSELNSVIL